MAALDKVRKGLVGNMAAMDQYRIRTGNVLTTQDALTKKIIEGKAHWGDLAKNMKLLGPIMRDQIALQRSLGIAWTQSSKTGKFSTDLAIPQNVTRDLKTFRSEMGLVSQAIHSASENTVKWGKNTQWAGRQLMVGFTVPLGIAAAATGKLAYDMDKAITQVVKVYGDASSGFQATTESIRTAAMTTAKAAASIFGQSAEDTLGIMAQLAASGKSGIELQQATIATTRAAVLGELDWQDAVKATISMQEVYQAGQQELADNWNYINAMENQTVLSAQDFVTAIPKVAGVMNELGGTLKDTGALLTAFKAAGIDAAEGANALKSINFRLVATYGKGLETFKNATGKDLRALIEQTNGETIPSLTAFAEAIKDLSAPDKVAVTRDVFGIYQGSKAMMLLDQMINKTEQWTQALDVANNTNIQNAAIAQQELDRQSERPFKKLDKAVETLKINLAEVGQVFLEPAAKLLNIINGLIEGFNNLNPSIKTMIAIVAGFIAIAGPVVMLAGLFANLAGNAMVLLSKVGMLASGFKAMTVEERMQQIASSKTIGMWDTQTASAAALNVQVQHLVASMNAVTGAQTKMQAALPAGMAYNKGGKPMYTADNPYGKPAGRQVKQTDLEAAVAMEATTAAAEKQTAAMTKLAHGVTAAAMAGGLLGTMFGPQEGVAYYFTQALNAVAIFGMLAPSLLIKAFTKISAAATVMGGRIRGAIGMGTASTGGFLKILKGAGPIIAAVAIAGYAAFEYFSNQIDQAVEKVKQFNGYAKEMADIIGFSYQEGGNIDPSAAPTGQRATEILAEKFKASNAAAAEQFANYGQNYSLGEKWGAAVAAGIDAKLHGATVEQAKDTARVAMQLMGETFTDKDFSIAIDAHINFDDVNAMMEAQIKNWQGMMDRAAVESGANWSEKLFNNGQISQTSAANIQKAGSDFWALFVNADRADRQKTLEAVAKENDAFINKAFIDAQKSHGPQLQALGVQNATDFAKGIQQGTIGMDTLGLTPEAFEDLKRRNGAMIEFARATAAAAGVSEDARGSIFRLFDLFRENRITGFFQETQRPMQGFEDGYKNIFTAAVGAAKGIVTSGKAVEYFQGAARGATIEAEAFNKNLQSLGYNSAITFEEMNTSWKNIYSGAQDEIFQNASDAFDQAQQDQMDALKKRGENALDDIEKRGDAIDKKFEKRQNELDARQDREKTAFDKAWDVRKDMVSKAYDARIKSIENAINAEQEAEKIRERIFEAEKTRIQRLAEMYSTNIDINMAIDSGKLDEAAKLQANAASQQMQWSIEDQSGNNQTASEKRIQALQDQKDAISEQKDARLKALDEIEQREKDAFDARQAREKESLKNQEKAAKEQIAIDKKKQQDLNQQHEAQLQKDQARYKKQLESQIATLRAFLPRNKKELQAQASALNVIYDKFGGDLKIKGNNWAGSVAKALSSKVAAEGNRLKSVVNWSQVGSDIATAMIKGAFNMTPQQFAKFINGGTAPTNSLFGTKPQSGVQKTTTQQRVMQYGGRINDPNLHKGGVAGIGGDYSRAGRSGEQSPSEVMTRLLVGEGIVSRKGMKAIGKAGLDSINGGGMGGGGELGMGSLPGVMGALVGKQLIAGSIAGAYNKRMGQTGNFLGSKSGVTPDYAKILGDVVTAATSQIYTTGKVVYLGHGAYPGGFNPGPTTRPAAGTVTSLFGPRNLLGMSFHNGIDIANASGTPIKSAAAGKVIFTGWDNTGYGNYTEIQSGDGTMFGYGHQSAIGVRAGQRVGTGQLIGRMGSTGKSTGPHLHFQTGRNGVWFNPRAVFPQLNTGGFVMKEGLANLHPKESVLTKPLTEDMKTGVQRFAEGPSAVYDINLNFDGATFNTQVDFDRAVEEAMRKMDKRIGVSRKVTVTR